MTEGRAIIGTRQVLQGTKGEYPVAKTGKPQSSTNLPKPSASTGGRGQRGLTSGTLQQIIQTKPTKPGGGSQAGTHQPIIGERRK